MGLSPGGRHDPFPLAHPEPSLSDSPSSSSLELSDTLEGTGAGPTPALQEWERPRRSHSSSCLDPILYTAQSAGPVAPSNAAEPDWLVDFQLLVFRLENRNGVSAEAAKTLRSFVASVVLPSCGYKGSCPSSSISWRSRLGLSEPSIPYVVCQNISCMALNEPKALTCRLCGRSLLRNFPPTGGLTPRRTIRPVLRFYYHPLVPWLSDLVKKEGMLAALNHWRNRPSNGGSSDIYDGQRWHEMADFLDGGELNLVLAMSLDWFQPFNFAASYSAGPIFLTILNLPPGLRKAQSNVHLLGVVPGPKEPSWDQLHHFFLPLVAELRRLEDGVPVSMPDRDSGILQRVRLRARLLFFIGDTPARSKFGGFCSHLANQNVCPFCLVSSDSFADAAKGIAVPQPRSIDQHRRDALHAVDLDKKEADAHRKATGASRCALYGLDYWRSVRDCPVDVMHAFYLGSVKRLWHRFLVLGGGLSMSELGLVQKRFAQMELPASMARLSPLTGSPAGGSPTAAQFATLGKVLYDILSDLWRDSVTDLRWRKSAGIRTEPMDLHDAVVGRHWIRIEVRVTARERPPEASTSQRQVSEADKEPDEDESRHDSDDDLPTRTSTTVPATSSRPGRQKAPRRHRLVHKGWFVETLVRPMSHITSLLFKGRLSSTEVDYVEDAIAVFVSGLAEVPFMTYNSHIISHIANHVRQYGPPRTFWAFGAEKGNQTLMQMARRSNKRPQDVERMIMRLWFDRQQIEAAIAARASAQTRDLLADSATRLSKKATDSHQPVSLDLDTICLGRACRPSLEACAYAVDSKRAGQSVSMKESDFRQLFEYIRYTSSDDGDEFVRDMLFLPLGKVLITNEAEFYGSMTYRGLFFCSAASRKNASVGNMFAFVRQAPEAEAQPVQILDIFCHAYKREERGQRVRVERTYIRARMLKSQAPRWRVEDAPFDHLDSVEVDLKAHATVKVIPATALLANATVVGISDRIALFLMSLIA